MIWLAAIMGAMGAAWSAARAARMGPLDCHQFRLGVVLIGAAGLCMALAPLYGLPPGWLYVAALTGAALAGLSPRTR